MFATNPQLGYTRCKTKNHWCSVNTHVQDGVGSMWLLWLPLKVATILFMDLCNQSPVRLPRWNTKNCWRFVDPHFQDGAGSLSLLFLPQKAANTSFMDVFNQLPLRLCRMERPKSLMLSWHSFSVWGSDHITISFAYKGCQYVGYI